MNLFEYIYPRFYFSKDKPIRLFEAFSGIGCQAMALKRITSNYELVGFSEIDKPAIQSYEAIHGEVKNYGDITKMVEIPQCDIFTWSFPCTDLSKAGKQKGLDGTRSGLVYEVLRLLKATEIKPKVLIMENVIDLVQVKFVNAFNEIQAELEQLGYTNYNEILNAKDYGIPQNRERVFMVSILKDEKNEHYSYDFPEPKKLELRLKDMLEDEVDEKYYLSEKALNGLKNTTFQSSKLENRTENEKGIMSTLCARDYKDPKLVKVAQLDCPPITANSFQENNFVAIPEATKKGYAEAHDGDGVYINRPEQKRGVVQKGMIQTLKTSGDDIGVVVENKKNLKEQMCEQLIKEGKVQENDVVKHSYTQQILDGKKKCVEKSDGVMIALTTRCDCYGVVVAAEIRTDEGIRTFDDNNMGALRTTGSCGDKVVLELNSQAVYNNLRIRKLTPKECWRLMGISDDDFDKARLSGMSNSQLYKQAGNGIVVNVFEAILRELIK